MEPDSNSLVEPARDAGDGASRGRSHLQYYLQQSIVGASVTIITLLYTLSALVLALGFPHGIGSNPLLIGTPALLALVMLYLRQGHETGFIGDLQSLRLYAEHVAATYVRASRLISIAGAVLMALLLAWFLVSGLKLGSEWANHFFKGTALACLPAVYWALYRVHGSLCRYFYAARKLGVQPRLADLYYRRAGDRVSADLAQSREAADAGS